jgi:nucleoside-diphosphate-sugar epimerase
VVITGASGSVGTAMLRCEAAAKTDIVAISRRPPDPADEPYDRATWIACDVGATRAPEILHAAMEGADAVVHLAWAIQPRRDEPAALRTNLRGTRNVLDAATWAKVPHLVVSSSAAAYRPAPRWTPVAEDWPTGGISASRYSMAKAELERMLDEFERRYSRPVVARVRPCAVVQREAGSEIARWTTSPFVTGRVLGRRWLPIPVWPRLRTQVVHADDVADALWSIVGLRAAGAFNLAADPVLSAASIAKALGGFPLPLPRRLLSALAWTTWRLGLQPAHSGWFAMCDRVCLLDPTRARSELGWRPRHDALTTLTDFAQGARDRAGTASPALVPQGGPREELRRLRPGRPSHQPA